ncbi:MAG: sodium-dependent transporter [Bacillota bacterium]|jgi:NSS family neurotransmitter:Na+ symporter
MASVTVETEPVSTTKARDMFSTKLGVIIATLGSAVGLGNIWKFPYLTGVNGGAAFVIIYILCTLAVGLPVMISEHVLGRSARADAIQTFKKLAPNTPWWLVSGAGVISAFLIMAFYTEVAGWVLAYVVKGIGGSILSSSPEVTSAAFGSLVTDPTQSLVWQWIVLAWVAAVIMMGVSKGIEKVTKTLMPVLFGILVIVCIRSITLPGAAQGLEFLFKPDFSKVTGATVLSAMGLSFFKLSVGMGTMITYGSYFRKDQDIPGTAFRVMLSDVAVSLLCGIAIFPAVFAFGFEPGAGPELLFVTIPAVFSAMPLGRILLPLFFVLAFIAATGAMLSLYEVPVAYLVGSFGWSRKKATIATLVGLAVVGSTAALSNSLTANWKILGMTPFDFFDWSTSSILMPLGGLMLCLFVGWRWGAAQLKAALSNEGTLNNETLISVFTGVVKVITPVAVLLVLLTGLKII